MTTLDLIDDFTMVNKSRQGVDIAYFDQLLQETGLSKGMLASLLGIEPRTIDNYRRTDRKFNTLMGELLMKIDNVFSLGRYVFDDVDSFREWLHTPARAFSGKKPLELLYTSTGVDLVSDQLRRIIHGYSV